MFNILRTGVLTEKTACECSLFPVLIKGLPGAHGVRERSCLNVVVMNCCSPNPKGKLVLGPEVRKDTMPKRITHGERRGRVERTRRGAKRFVVFDSARAHSRKRPQINQLAIDALEMRPAHYQRSKKSLYVC